MLTPDNVMVNTNHESAGVLGDHSALTTFCCCTESSGV